MTQSKNKASYFVQILIWIFLYIISNIFSDSFYLFEWVIHNKIFYIGLGLLSIIVSLVNKNIGWGITLGNSFGLLIGHLLGEYIRIQSMLKITPDMSTEMQYKLKMNYGVFIWISCILISSLISVLLELKSVKK